MLVNRWEACLTQSPPIEFTQHREPNPWVDMMLLADVYLQNFSSWCSEFSIPSTIDTFSPKRTNLGSVFFCVIPALKSLLNDLRGQPLRRVNTEATNVLNCKVGSEGWETNQAKSLPTPGSARPLLRNPRKWCGVPSAFAYTLAGKTDMWSRAQSWPGSVSETLQPPEQNIQCAPSLGFAGAEPKRPLFKVTFLPAFFLHTRPHCFPRFLEWYCLGISVFWFFFFLFSDELWEENRKVGGIAKWPHENIQSVEQEIWCL